MRRLTWLLMAPMLLAAGAASLSAQETAGQIMALPQAKLIELLGNPGSSVFEKAKACQRLAVIGGKEAVPALAALLTDPQMGHYARFGLEPIPDPSADDALRGALDKTSGKLKAGVITSIGHRKDTKAVEPLGKLLGAPDVEVAQAAAAALGNIGGPESAKRLKRALGKAKAPVRPAVADAGLVCAEGLLAQGGRKEALGLYRALQRGGLPEPVRAAARDGIQKAR